MSAVATMPTISVIIPCYNASAFLRDAILSVLQQAHTGVECIVVDDGSTDGSADIARSEFGSQITLLVQKNSGAAAARNRGLAAASGELVVWLDADDQLTPHSLAKRQQAFVDDPNLEMLVGQNRIVDIDSGLEEVSPERCDADYLVRDLLARTNLPHSNILTFRRAALRRVGAYDSTLTIGEDYDLWMRAWALLRWRFIRQVQSIQRTGSFPSLSRSQGKLFFYQQVGAAMRKNRAFLRRHTGSDRPWRRGYARYAADFAVIYLDRGAKRSAFRWATTAIATAPFGVERRAYWYLLESVLPASVYEMGRKVVRRTTGRVGKAPAGLSVTDVSSHTPRETL